MIDYANELIEEIQRLKPTDAIAIKVDGEFEIESIRYNGSHISINCYMGTQSLKDRISELENEKYDLESKLDDTECERDNIEGELEDLQRTNEDLTEQRDFHLNRVKALESENEKLKAEIKRFQKQIEVDNGDRLF